MYFAIYRLCASCRIVPTWPRELTLRRLDKTCLLLDAGAPTQLPPGLVAPLCCQEGLQLPTASLGLQVLDNWLSRQLLYTPSPGIQICPAACLPTLTISSPRCWCDPPCSHGGQWTTDCVSSRWSLGCRSLLQEPISYLKLCHIVEFIPSSDTCQVVTMQDTALPSTGTSLFLVLQLQRHYFVV